MNYKLLGIDGSVYGPVTDAQVRQWINEGRANAQTQAQSDASPEWKPLSAFPEFAAALAVPPMPRHLVADVAQPASAEEINDILKRDYSLDIGGCISGWWALLKQDYWNVFAATLVIVMINGAAGALPYGVGYIISLFLSGQLMGGLYWYYIRKIRGHNPQIGEVFTGFKRNSSQLMLTNICVSLATTLVPVLGGIALVIGLIVRQTTASQGQIILATGAFLLAASIPVAIYLGIAWFFALALVIDKQLGFWDAMETSRKVVHKHWWTLFGLGLASGFIYILGICGCGIGILFTMPIALGAMIYAYEHIFGSLYKKPIPMPAAPTAPVSGEY
jgi:uncharacterized membrane protein